MRVFRLTEEHKEKKKKQQAITSAIEYLAAAGALAYVLLVVEKGSTFQLVFVGGLVFIAVLYFLNRKHYSWLLDSTKLMMNEKGLKIHVPRKVDQLIAMDEVKEIKNRKDGIEIINKIPRRRSVIVSDGFENFSLIEQLVSEHVSREL